MAEPPSDNVVIRSAATGDVQHEVPANAAADIRGLKLHLAQLCGRPRFQLRLLHKEQMLQDQDIAAAEGAAGRCY